MNLINRSLLSTLIMSFLFTTGALGQTSQSQDTHDFLTSKYDMYSPKPEAVLSGNVGYYDMSAGQGLMPEQSDPIVAADCTPVQIFDLSAAELSNIDVLFAQNPSNGSYGAEYLGQLAAIENAVNNGMTLIIHDRYVTGAASILPGGGGVTAVRNTSTDETNVDIVDNSTPVTVGLDNTSLDGGNLSSHGYVDATTLPAGALNILSRTIPAESVLFSYPHGAGAVIYSTIPLDFYLGGNGNNPPRDNMVVYASNVITYAKTFLPQIVPTLSEWGLIVLGLLFLICGVVFIRGPELKKVVA